MAACVHVQQWTAARQAARQHQQQPAALRGGWPALPVSAPLKPPPRRRLPSLRSPPRPAALPTLVLFKDGQPIDRIEGVVMGPDLKARLEYLLANPPKK